MTGRIAGRALHLWAAMVLAACLLSPWPGAARSAKPKASPGRDPGGVAVAVIGSGLDYRRPDVAQRLARDGEGEPIGWDFADEDARPFSSADADGALARIVLAEGQATRLVLTRVAVGRQEQVAAALRFVGETPARVVLVVADTETPLPLAGLAEAARHLSRLLLVVPMRRVSGDPSVPVAAADRGGLLLVAADGGDAAADVMAAAGSAASGSHPDDAAAARVAAMAARLLAVEPSLAGAALRTRLLSFTRPQPSGPPTIPDIGRLQRLE